MHDPKYRRHRRYSLEDDYRAGFYIPPAPKRRLISRQYYPDIALALAVLLAGIVWGMISLGNL